MKLPEVGSVWEYWDSKGKYWYTIRILKVFSRTKEIVTQYLNYPEFIGHLPKENDKIPFQAIADRLKPHKAQIVKKDLEELLK